jgi:hypothetical protein
MVKDLLQRRYYRFGRYFGIYKRKEKINNRLRDTNFLSMNRVQLQPVLDSYIQMLLVAYPFTRARVDHTALVSKKCHANFGPWQPWLPGA